MSLWIWIAANIKDVADWKCVVTAWIAANIKYMADWKCIDTVDCS